jgi:hypothetical protein
MTKPRLWEELHLSQWGRIKAMADHLGFKVHRLKSNQCRLLMPNVEAKEASGKSRKEKPRRWAAALLAKAANGDVPAINSLADRTDGKVAQALIGAASEDAMQVHHTIVRKIVEPDAK